MHVSYSHRLLTAVIKETVNTVLARLKIRD